MSVPDTWEDGPWCKAGEVTFTPKNGPRRKVLVPIYSNGAHLRYSTDALRVYDPDAADEFEAAADEEFGGGGVPA